MQNSLGKASKIQLEILKYPFDWRAGATVVKKQNIQKSSEWEGRCGWKSDVSKLQPFVPTDCDQTVDNLTNHRSDRWEHAAAH